MKAAVVGLGIGHAHCAGYLQSSHTELAAVCDLLPERLSSVGGSFEQGGMKELRRLYPPELLGRSWEEIGVKTYTSLTELLRNESIEIISLCTPDHTHAKLAVQILRAGRHLLLEKPLALSLPEAEAIGQAMKKDKWQRWIQKQATSGGLIVEETSHWLDLLRFITGDEVAELCCHTSDAIHPDFDFEDIAFIQGDLMEGGVFQISHALSGFDFNLAISVHGKKATVWCHLKDSPVSRLDGMQSKYCGLVAWGDPNRGADAARSREYGPEVTEPHNIRDFTRHFVRCIVGRQKPVVGYEDALKALELSIAAREAAQSGSLRLPKEANL
jgi:predicted dehydrogenase